jgi:hypothetical protein
VHTEHGHVVQQLLHQNRTVQLQGPTGCGAAMARTLSSTSAKCASSTWGSVKRGGGGDAQGQELDTPVFPKQRDKSAFPSEEATVLSQARGLECLPKRGDKFQDGLARRGTRMTGMQGGGGGAVGDNAGANTRGHIHGTART